MKTHEKYLNENYLGQLEKVKDLISKTAMEASKLPVDRKMKGVLRDKIMDVLEYLIDWDKKYGKYVK